jgi:hypothetical protein
MVSYAALAGAQSIIILNSISLEDLHAAIIHSYRYGKMKLSSGMAQELMHTGIEVKNLGTIVKLLLGYLKWIGFGHLMHLHSTEIFMFDWWMQSTTLGYITILS